MITCLKRRSIWFKLRLRAWGVEKAETRADYVLGAWKMETSDDYVLEAKINMV